MVLPWSRDSKQFWVLPRSQSSLTRTGDIPQEKEYGPNIKKFGARLKLRADEAAEGEEAASSRLWSGISYEITCWRAKESDIVRQGLGWTCRSWKQTVQTWPSANWWDKLILIEWSSTTRITYCFFFSEWGVSTHAIDKKVLCVRLWNKWKKWKSEKMKKWTKKRKTGKNNKNEQKWRKWKKTKNERNEKYERMKRRKRKMKKMKKWKMKEMHSERRHFVLLCGGAARGNTSVLSAIAGGLRYLYMRTHGENSLAPSRIGKPRKSSSRKSCENSQEVAELKRFAWLKLERTEQLRVDDLSRQKFTNVSLQWISWRFKLRNCKIKCTLWMVLPWSGDSKQFWVLPRSQSSFICSEFFRKALPRF